MNDDKGVSTMTRGTRTRLLAGAALAALATTIGVGARAAHASTVAGTSQLYVGFTTTEPGLWLPAATEVCVYGYNEDWRAVGRCVQGPIQPGGYVPIAGHWQEGTNDFSGTPQGNVDLIVILPGGPTWVNVALSNCGDRRYQAVQETLQTAIPPIGHTSPTCGKPAS